MILNFALWASTVWMTGFLLLGATPARALPLKERAAAGGVVGSAVLPLLLFLINWLTGWPIISKGVIGDIFIGALTLTGATLVVRMTLARPTRPEAAKPAPAAPPRRIRRSGLRHMGDAALMVILAIAMGAFYYWVWRGVRRPIFGWDEYSFWLYAAKALLVHGGSGSAMARDPYASYPLSFPYLVAWCYRLTGGVSIERAKWVTPAVTTAFFWSLYVILRRFRVRPSMALLGVVLAAWGSQMILWYNLIAYGEMAYVCVYVLALLYAASWLDKRESPHQSADLFMFALLLGLSAFVRVDGVYVAIMTLLVLVIVGGVRQLRQRGQKRGSAAFALVFPFACWEGFKLSHHVHAGWLSRITIGELGARLQPAFLARVVAAVWFTMTNFTVYPIVLLLFLMTVIAFVSRNRVTLFLVLIAYAQIVYLLAAYVSVFSVFEALHASSLDRYLLRIDPITAAAFVIWFAAASDRPPAALQDDGETGGREDITPSLARRRARLQ